MKKHFLLFTMLLALMVPMAAIGQGSLPFNQNFNSVTTLPNGWSNFVQQGSGTSIIVNSRLALVCTAVPENNPRIAIFGVRIPSNNTGDNVMHLAFDYSGDQGVIIGYVQSNAFHTIQSYDVTNGITSKTLQVAFPTNARLAFITGATGVTGIDPDTQRPSSNFATIDNVSITSVRPTNLAASNIDDNSATITWNANNASKWEVQYKPSSASDWMNVSGTLITNTCLLSNLSAGTSYDVRVKTKANSGNYYTDWSSVYTFNTVACAAPTNLTVSNLTSNSATVNWESAGNWFHYQYRESGEEEWIEDGGYGGTGSTFASLTEVLEPNTTYEFRVQNICNLDPLEESSYATTQFTTETIPCSAPTGLTVSFTETGYRFSWDAESGYDFYYTDAPVGNSPTWNTNHTSNNYIDYYDHNVEPNVDWTFYLKKKCSENVYSEPVSITFHTKCTTTTALGYSENFDGYTVPSAYNPSTRTLPDCWNAINTTTYELYSVYPSIYNYYDYAHSGSNCLTIYSSYSTINNHDPQPQYAILPLMDDLGGVQVTLWAKGDSNSASVPSSFKIGTMSDPADASTFTMIAEQPLTTSYLRYVYNIPANTTDK
ncbi:MAG: fibronectin type III domain-containing protein, partial [Bacteroidales bacterium]|nr:fibronectin type III domain-containing protein [Bacteroidales bacterium]